jgi:hypothetical protein
MDLILTKFFENIKSHKIKSTTNTKFFSFGCWNLGSCDNNKHLRKIVDRIIANRDEYEFGIISGDNVYPFHPIKHDKYNKRKFKLHKAEFLKEGFKCLLTIKLPLYVALGNHDVMQCDILTEHINLTKNKNIILPSNYYDFKYNFNNTIVHFIVIDTNLLTTKHNNCFTDVASKSNLNIVNEMNKMLKWIKQIIVNTSSENIVIIGHYPLLSCKKKNVIKINNYNKLINILSSSKNKNITYLCSDTHNYQHLLLKTGKISINIVIVGTGGGMPDKINKDDKKLYENDFNDNNTEKIKIIKLENSYGYCEVSIVDNNIMFRYIHIDDIDYKAQYIKYKNRYMLLSNKKY